MYQVSTADSILLEDGQRLKPVASFLSKSNKSHVVAEEGFYVVYAENPAGRSCRTPWISKEAWSVLSHLPSPDGAKLTPSQLSVAARDLANVERASPGYEQLVETVNRLLSKTLHEELANIVLNGPLWDGDTISSKSKDALHQLGLATYVVFKGEEGFSAATYQGLAVYRLASMTLEASA